MLKSFIFTNDYLQYQQRLLRSETQLPTFSRLNIVHAEIEYKKAS